MLSSITTEQRSAPNKIIKRLDSKTVEMFAKVKKGRTAKIPQEDLMQNIKSPYGSTFSEFNPKSGVGYQEKKATKLGPPETDPRKISKSDYTKL